MAESNVFHRCLDKRLPKAIKAQGVLIYDDQGNKYLDASGGPICVNVGHARKEIAEAVYRQICEIAYVHGPMFTTESIEKLAAALSRHAPEGIDRFYFCSGGGEAVETAIKLARQIHLCNGEPKRYRTISRWLSYHGATLGTLAVGGKTSMRQSYIDMLPASIHIPAPYCLRCHYNLSYPGCDLRCGQVLEDVILLEGKESISAFIAEPVCGATIGAVVPPPGYNRRISEICKKYGVLLIFDEIMTGIGRTGKWFASEHEDIRPDIIILAKGLSSGYLPLSAVGCKASHVESIRQFSGNFIHGGTFSHHAVSGAAALSVIEIIERENLVDQSQKMGHYLGKILQPLCELEHVVDVRGIGLMRAIELVEDKDRLTPYPRSMKVAENLFKKLLDVGLITYPCMGFAGGQGDALMLGPPFIITEEQLNFCVEKIKSVILEILS